MTLTYYLYLSHLKLGLLAAQLTSDAQHETEVAVDLKFVRYSRKAVRPERHDLDKLAKVVRHLQDADQIGAAGDSRPYFQAGMRMRWQVFPTAGIVVFAGTLDGQAIVLGGSASHVVGGGAAEPVGSVPPYLFRKLQELRPDPGEFDDERFHEALSQIGAGLPGPAQWVEFIAKRLTERPGPGGALLGSPIYVALAD
ncbi:SAVMC3_10250 family protein [Micromonospora sp. WMMD1128]|uniref:DUF7019 family protein n=1 Tax=Micromonospora sp. WMMD1128 TaxID=3015150 RepID=UPI00248BD22E|nr:SAVMC3_10250 family protein [Micromonospora sp. WMMD1128]WBB76605.1 SAVMC3_10250 family protein [Micromonospora sp. WMMD1128]